MAKEAIINYFCKIIWKPISICEKGYWFIQRNVQKQAFKKCGKDVFISRYCFISGKIYIGNDIYIGQNCRFQSTVSKIIIGDHVMFGPGVTMHGGNHRIDLLGTYMKEITFDQKRPEDDKDIIIENDVWIGGNAIILQGVTIGEGSVVGAGSVITKNVPLYTIVVGSKVQKSWERFDKAKLERHKRLIFERELFIKSPNPDTK
jgi:acetyltransferase-like isoleucine patch superfamily enzyme